MSHPHSEELGRDVQSPSPSQSHTVASSQETSSHGAKKSVQFWLVFLGTSTALFLSALELTSVGTALPTIVKDLEGPDFIWIGSAYGLASAAFMPASGGLSNIFGRRAIMLGSIAIFAAGSAIGGAAQSMNMLIVGRTIQGAGGGSIIAMTEIIVADLVPLRERGKFGGIIGAVWSLASMLGPPIGGALASAGQWRWLFYMNLPLSAVSATLVFCFLRMKTPKGKTSDKLKQIDWIGNAIIIASTASVILSLTWGGVKYPWSSYHVLVPLVLGLAGIVSFMLYEFFIAPHPIVPRHLLGNRTSLSGYSVTFIHGIVVTLVVFYLPTYFQGSKGASAIRSGVLLFATAILIAPFAIITGQSVERTGHYLIQNYIGWVLVMIGYGTLSLLTATSSIAMGEGLQVIGAIGFGVLYVAPNFSILAPLRVEDNAHALALMSYLRTFGQTFGITLGTTILQNGLKSRLPTASPQQFPSGVEVSYAIIPLVKSLPEPLQSQVKAAFADSISKIWLWVVGLAGAGLLMTLPMQQMQLNTTLDEKWGLENERREEQSVEGKLERGELPAVDHEKSAGPSSSVPTPA